MPTFPPDSHLGACMLSLVKRLLKGDELVRNAERIALQDDVSRLCALKGLPSESLRMLDSNEYVAMMDKHTSLRFRTPSPRSCAAYCQ